MFNIIIYLKYNEFQEAKKIKENRYKWMYDETNLPLPGMNSSISRYLSCVQRYILKFWEIGISLNFLLFVKWLHCLLDTGSQVVNKETKQKKLCVYDEVHAKTKWGNGQPRK